MPVTAESEVGRIAFGTVPGHQAAPVASERRLIVFLIMGATTATPPTVTFRAGRDEGTQVGIHG